MDPEQTQQAAEEGSSKQYELHLSWNPVNGEFSIRGCTDTTPIALGMIEYAKNLIVRRDLERSLANRVKISPSTVLPFRKM